MYLLRMEITNTREVELNANFLCINDENKMKYIEELIHFLLNDKYWMRFLEFQTL